MKTKTLRNVLYGMAMLTASACVEEELVNEVPLQAEFEADIEAPSSAISVFEGDIMGTRTYIDENDAYESGVGTLWRPKEVIGVYSNYSKNTKFTSTNSSNAASVSFSGFMLGTPKYAYYPYGSNNNGVSQTAVKGNMPATQDFNQTYKDIVGDYRAGTLDSRSWFSSTFTFKRLVSILKFSINATGTVLEGSNLHSVSMKVSNKRQMAGDFTINLQTQTITPGTFKEGNDSITVNYGGYPELGNGVWQTAYMTTLPHLVKGDKVTFTIRTNTHIASFSRTFNVSFVPNDLYTFQLALKDFSDLVITEVPAEPAVTPVLNSLKFTVANNTGKILAREFTMSGNTPSPTPVEEKECTIDPETGKISLYLPYLNNRRLVPTFEIPEGTRLILEDGQEIESGKDTIDFTQVKALGVINSANAVVWYSIELTNTGLPVVVINQESGTTETESNSDYEGGSNVWYKATGAKWQPKDSDWEMTEGKDNFMVYNADGTSALTDKSGNVVEEPILASTRVRGNVTQHMPKKPFAVKLDSKSGVLDMPAHKRWVLLANWKDRTLMRNEVAFGLAEVLKNTPTTLDDGTKWEGMAWNPSGQFVELVYNGVHVGTYYLCEQIKIDGNRLNINDPYDEKDGYSGEATGYGYLLECDDGYDETWKFLTKMYIPFLFKDDGNDDMLTYASTLVRGVEENLSAGNYTAAYEKLDLMSVIDYWLIQEMMMNSETKHPKSVYMYINDDKLYAGPVWDFDWNTLPTSTSYSEEGFSYTTSMLKKASTSKSSSYPTSVKENDAPYMWYTLLTKDATFKSMAAQRWNCVKEALLGYASSIPSMRTPELIKSEALNAQMWPLDSKSSPKRSSWYNIGVAIGSWYVSSCGYCGDEAMTFENAVNTLSTTLTTRINGMSYISNQNW